MNFNWHVFILMNTIEVIRNHFACDWIHGTIWS